MVGRLGWWLLVVALALSPVAEGAWAAPPPRKQSLPEPRKPRMPDKLPALASAGTLDERATALEPFGALTPMPVTLVCNPLQAP
jgi:hypothetical protein